MLILIDLFQEEVHKEQFCVDINIWVKLRFSGRPCNMLDGLVFLRLAERNNSPRSRRICGRLQGAATGAYREYVPVAVTR
ncbi:hypothetical protein DESC_320039 [Desulfosarcina cetonica]|nr:hypothetical protein DESC_320039 [Desulfosarcina cetonica]